MSKDQSSGEEKSRFRQWFDLNYYRYEVNTGMYVLEPWEKKLFSIFSIFIFQKLLTF